MDFFTPIATLISGGLEARAIGKIAKASEDWAWNFYCLVMSIAASGFCTFLGTWGAVALAMWKATGIWIGLGVGFASALVSTASVVYVMWTTSAYTKGMSITVTSQVADAAVNTNTVSTNRN